MFPFKSCVKLNRTTGTKTRSTLRILEQLENRQLLAADIVNLPVANLGPTSATIGVEVVNTGGATPNVSLYWGKSDGGTSTGQWENRIRIGDRGVGMYTTDLTELEIGTDYFFRSYSFSLLGGESWAPETTAFQTTPPEIPQVSVNAVDRVGATSINVGGSIIENGGQTPLVSLYYGDNDGANDPSQWDNVSELGLFDGPFATRITKLSPSTGYFYRFAAQNNGGIGWTDTVSFQTANAAPLQISEISAAGGTGLATRVRGAADKEFGGDPVEYDWIEIENNTAAPIDIGNHFLSDRKDNPKRWQIPAGTVVPEFGVVTIFASGFDVSDSNLDESGRVHASFKLDRDGEFVGLFSEDESLIHSIDPFAPQFPGQTYGMFGDQQNYFYAPTPDELNRSGESKLAPTPTISLDSRTFSDQLTVEFHTPLEGGLIRYTVDGEVPTEESNLYTEPITITESTRFRVRTFAEGHVPSEIAAESYIFFESEIADYQSDLPVFVLDNFGGRRPSKARQVPFRMMLFDVDSETGISSVQSTPDLDMRIGLKVRGQSSSGDPKTPMRIELRNQYDEDVDVGLLGLPEESDWVLYGPWSDRTLVHNVVAYDLADSIGIDAPRTRFVEVFRNQRSGPMEADDFLGLYVLVESIKRSDNRIDIPRLDAGDVAEPDISGGYIVRFEQNVSERDDRLAGWQHLELFDGQKYTAEQKDWITNYINQADAAIESANENRSYEEFIDVDSFINTILISELGRDQDAYVRSHYYYKDRGGKLIAGPIWDFNLIWNRGCCFDNRNPRGWQFDQDRPGQPTGWNKGQHNWYGDLMDSPFFAQKLIDRWAELRQDGNEFSLESLFDRIDKHVSEISDAVERNYTRWPNMLTSSSGFGGPRFPTYQEHIDDMKNWIRRRVEWIDEQFRQPPTITVDNQSMATLVGSGGDIYYTTDGSDPFNSENGEPSANAIRYEQPFAVSDSARVVARLRDTSVAPRRTEMILTQWSSPATFGAVPGDLNGDLLANSADIQLLCEHINGIQPANDSFDLNGDGSINQRDMDELVMNLLNSSYGDANLDGVFDSKDLVDLLQSDEYEDGIDGNSTWATGDFNCDGDFNTRDLVLAFERGNYTANANA